MKFQFRQSWIIVQPVEHIGLFVIVWGKDDVVHNMFQSLGVASQRCESEP